MTQSTKFRVLWLCSALWRCRLLFFLLIAGTRRADRGTDLLSTPLSEKTQEQTRTLPQRAGRRRNGYQILEGDSDDDRDEDTCIIRVSGCCPRAPVYTHCLARHSSRCFGIDYIDWLCRGLCGKGYAHLLVD